MSEARIQLGVIGRPHGVRGLVRVHSYTAVPAELPDYGPFEDARGRVFTLRFVSDGVAEVSEIAGGRPIPVRDRSVAEALVNTPLFVPRARLPAAAEEEFYLADLVGLAAFAPDGTALGQVSVVHDYGAGASLEIGAHLVPFTRACVPMVDLAGGRLTVVLPEEVVVVPTAVAAPEGVA
jgi:16S rRNA processing protein RimM